MDKDHVDYIQSQWKREKPNLDTTPMGIIGRLSRISRYINQRLQENFEKFNLNGGEFDVLASLRRSGAPYQLTPTELYNTAMLSSGAMTNRLDRLEEENLIARHPNPEDRRGTLVKLTETGLSLIDQVFPLHLDHEGNMIASLSKSERDAFKNMLRKVLYSFENYSK